MPELLTEKEVVSIYVAKEIVREATAVLRALEKRAVAGPGSPVPR
jgi:hypothetical protein